KKRPGRKAGHEASWRRPPEHIDHRVEVPLAGCPHCGSNRLERLRPLTQYIEELPPQVVQVTELKTWRGECPRCGPVESTHPLKTSSAAGAAGTGLGPRAQAVATYAGLRPGAGPAADLHDSEA